MFRFLHDALMAISPDTSSVIMSLRAAAQTTQDGGCVTVSALSRRCAGVCWLLAVGCFGSSKSTGDRDDKRYILLRGSTLRRLINYIKVHSLAAGCRPPKLSRMIASTSPGHKSNAVRLFSHQDYGIAKEYVIRSTYNKCETARSTKHAPASSLADDF
jgi:hypothetical protein